MVDSVVFNGEPVSFQLEHVTLAGKRWGNPDGIPVIALHGWLDNCLSFDLLAPLLKNVHLIAIDSAGHGESSHRAPGCSYLIWDDVSEVIELADLLGWDKFTLLGHSRGAVISVLTAGTFPERVTHVGLLDCLVPFIRSPQQAPEQLANAIENMRKLKNKPQKAYPDYEELILARMNATYALSRKAAELLMARNIKEKDSLFYVSTDQRLRVPSAVYFSEEHMLAFLNNISAPIKLVLAEDGLATRHPELSHFVDLLDYIHPVWLEGGHHFHMEGAAEKIAVEMNRFFSQ